MPISAIPIFSILRTKMQWHQERQKLLAENVSNADMPNFKPRDLAAPKFDGPTPAAGGATLALARTSPGHIGASASATQFQLDRNGRFEVRPAGSGVNLAEEMLKVATNQMDYQATRKLYSRSPGLIKTAIGKR